MATLAAPVLVPDLFAVPSSFQQALKLGWKIAKEESLLDDGERERHGVVLLRRKGFPFRLRVEYTATRGNWTFAEPKQIE
ncbi:MAG TPA: hypothetical protein VFE02_10175 [Candidatus Acidoferrales bacterium]|jgi:hypothetical protein|nr:hypothetical protein [Candidatus Acidoferrales bacterium]